MEWPKDAVHVHTIYPNMPLKLYEYAKPVNPPWTYWLKVEDKSIARYDGSMTPEAAQSKFPASPLGKNSL
jgi:hypothetical protein